MQKLARDPFNIVITGVGGQGNVTASRTLGSILVDQGYQVTIGETFGASQRGGSVTSSMRVSADSTWSPQIPAGKADLVVALEPTEAIKVLSKHGNREVTVICNMRPVYSVRVIAGEVRYPGADEIKQAVRELSARSFFLEATDQAIKLGNPILANVIMLGAVGVSGVLPISRDGFEKVASRTLSGEKLRDNLAAYETGERLAREQGP
jgi:indolepyruvate ferredoxin oxidoreductase beta subunit